MAAGVPAQVLGLDGPRGAIEAGRHADLGVLDEELHVRDVYVRGTLVG